MQRSAFALSLLAAIAAAPVAHAAPVAIVVSYESQPSGDYQYLPGGDDLPADTLIVDQGGTLQFGNAGRTEHHSITSFALKPDKTPLFDSGLIPPNAVKEVPGISALAPGRYTFYCRKHQYQQGHLVVQ